MLHKGNGNPHIKNGTLKTGEVTGARKDILRITAVFIVTSWLWLFFQLDSVRDVLLYTGQMLTGWDKAGSINIDICIFCVLYCIPVLLYHLLYYFRIFENEKVWGKLRPFVYSVMVLMLLVGRGTEEAFIYLQF